MPLVTSSVIQRMFYDAFARELDIVFTTGKTYRYFDVPPKIYAGFVGAASKGEFFNRFIRDAYRFEKR